jgi:hypothetical protein
MKMTKETVHHCFLLAVINASGINSGGDTASLIKFACKWSNCSPIKVMYHPEQIIIVIALN